MPLKYKRAANLASRLTFLTHFIFPPPTLPTHQYLPCAQQLVISASKTVPFLKESLAESFFKAQPRQVLPPSWILLWRSQSTFGISFFYFWLISTHDMSSALKHQYFCMCFVSSPSDCSSSGIFIFCSQQMLHEPSLTFFYDKLPTVITLTIYLWILMLSLQHTLSLLPIFLICSF